MNSVPTLMTSYNTEGLVIDYDKDLRCGPSTPSATPCSFSLTPHTVPSTRTYGPCPPHPSAALQTTPVPCLHALPAMLAAITTTLPDLTPLSLSLSLVLSLSRCIAIDAAEQRETTLTRSHGNRKRWNFNVRFLPNPEAVGCCDTSASVLGRPPLKGEPPPPPTHTRTHACAHNTHHL
jgi:hypothetical protein